ncbi:MAG: permease-like cell division protein FtsX [Bacteroidales bacterium]|nr:permease-like cell division protein FtsX [Bacteroidales bacterium]MCL2133077.1 permease-like cell division protein FtsX [Bacteroidales bacterium]
MAKREQNISIRRLRSSYLSALISISLVLFLLGVSGILLINARRLSVYFKENITFTIILDDATNDADAAWVRKQLDVAPYIRETKFVTKEQAAEEMKALLGSDFMEVFDFNPLPLAVEAKLTAEYAVVDSIVKIERQLLSIPHIREISYQRSLIDLVNHNIQKISLVMLVFIVLMLFIALVLINNTIRLSVYARRFIINTMRLVGATPGFIVRPFLLRSLLQGVLSGVIAIMLLTGVLYVVQNEFGEIIGFFEDLQLLLLFLSIIVMGMLISFISTFFAAKRYVRIDVGKLYF